jgi:Putative peptidoglycan binding domain
MSGPDVEELQGVLAPFHPGTVDGRYGPQTASAVKQAKWALGYPDAQCNGSAGPKLVAYLQGAPPPPDFVARQQARQHDAQKALTVREQIVANARWGVANEAQIHYEQLRPIDAIHEAQRLPLRTDCSGFATLCYAWAGASDPNGLDFNGQGYTGTMLQHLRRVPQPAVQPGDLVIWGRFPGNHVALVLEAGPDPLLCSHGTDKGPVEVRFSAASKYHSPPVVWLSGLP